jgi:glucose/arabinose dehydrogenase
MRLVLAGLAAGALAAFTPFVSYAPAAPAPRFLPTRGLALETVATGLDHPVHLTAPAGDARLFVVEQPGRIRIIARGRLLARPFLDLTDRVSDGGERGLLSVAFHPDYAHNGFFFVDYTDRHGDTAIERFTVSRDPDLADKGSAVRVLSIAQPYANHNGGLVAFAPDGMLWIGMGDGGSGGDPHGNGQKPQALLGKMLRLDVDHGRPYAIPRDNPFAGRRDGRPEIWAMGLRNPWRYSFDRVAGEVYIADVGQNLWEEVDVAPIAAGRLNYGWNRMEGLHTFRPVAGDTARLTAPMLEYGHHDGCSVTGGLVYRGARIPALRGHYLFSDYCSGWLRSFRYDRGQVSDLREWRGAETGAVASFGEDAAGEAYIVSHNGSIFRIIPESKRP